MHSHFFFKHYEVFWKREERKKKRKRRRNIKEEIQIRTPRKHEQIKRNKQTNKQSHKTTSTETKCESRRMQPIHTRKGKASLFQKVVCPKQQQRGYNMKDSQRSHFPVQIFGNIGNNSSGEKKSDHISTGI